LAHGELDTKAFELVFSLTIVVWLLDLSKDLPTKYEAAGWVITLIMVILFCSIVQHTKKVNSVASTMEWFPYITTQSEKHTRVIRNYQHIGGVLLIIFLELAVYSNNWHLNRFNEFDYSFVAKYSVLFFGWYFLSMLDSYINIRNKRLFEEEGS